MMLWNFGRRFSFSKGYILRFHVNLAECRWWFQTFFTPNLGEKISNLKKTYFPNGLVQLPTSYCFPRKLLNLLGVFLGVLVLMGLIFGVVRGIQLRGLFAVTSSKISRMEGIGFTKMWSGTPWPTSHANWNPWTHLKWKKAEGCWNFHPCKAPFFCTVLQFGC